MDNNSWIGGRGINASLDFITASCSHFNSARALVRTHVSRIQTIQTTLIIEYRIFDSIWMKIWAQTICTVCWIAKLNNLFWFSFSKLLVICRFPDQYDLTGALLIYGSVKCFNGLFLPGHLQTLLNFRPSRAPQSFKVVLPYEIASILMRVSGFLQSSFIDPLLYSHLSLLSHLKQNNIIIICISFSKLFLYYFLSKQTHKLKM